MTDNLQAQDLLNRIFVPNPDERITLEEILQHEWMTGPILSDDELQVEMNERFTIIQDTLAEQRAAVIGVKRLRDEDDFQPNKSFNPFDMDSEAHRGYDNVLMSIIIEIILFLKIFTPYCLQFSEWLHRFLLIIPRHAFLRML